MADNLDPNTIEQLNRAFEELSKTSQTLGGSFSTTDTQIFNTGVSASKLTKHFDGLLKNIDSLNKSVKTRDAQEKKSAASAEREAAANKKLQESSKDAASALNSLSAKSSKIAENLEDTGEMMKGFANLFGATAEEYQKRAQAQSKSFFTAAGRSDLFSKEMKRASEQLTKLSSIDNIGRSLSEMAKVSFDFTKGLAKGETSFTSLNPIIDLVSNALGGLLKTIPFFGEALNAGQKAIAEASKFMIEQVQGALKDFQDVSKFGGLVADGMMGLQRQFIASGMTMDGFKKVVKDNADALASTFGTVGKGTERFSNIVGSLTTSGGAFENLGDDLRKLGMTADDIGESAGFYLQQELRLGRARARSDAELADGAAKYAKELDALQKLTGESKEALQKQQDALMADSRYRATYQEMLASNNEVGAKALDNILKIIGPESELGVATKTFAAEMGYTTDESRKAALTFGDEYRQMVEDLKYRRITEDQFIQRLSEMGKSSLEAGTGIAQMAKIAGKDSPFLDYAKTLDLSSRLQGKSLEEALKVQNKQTTATDDTTKKTIEAQKSMENMARTMKNLAFQFLPEAATAVTNLTSSLDDLVDWIAETTGKEIGTPEQRAARKTKREIRTLENELSSAEMGTPVTDAMGTQTGQVQRDQGLIDRLKQDIGNKQLGLTKNRAAQRLGSSVIPGLAGSDMSSVMQKIVGVESGAGGMNAQAKTSSAYGLGQFTIGTFNDLAKRKDSPVYGKTWEEYKKDPAIQIAALQDLTKRNQEFLTNNKMQVTDATTYLAHFLGATGAMKILSADNSADVRKFIGDKEYEANRSVFDKAKTVGELKMWAAQKMGEDPAAILGQAVPKARYGGVFDGPESGYMAILHGREMVSRVPKTDGVRFGGVSQSTAPVVESSNNSNRELVSVFSALSDKIDDLISLTRETNRNLDQQLTYAKA